MREGRSSSLFGTRPGRGHQVRTQDDCHHHSPRPNKTLYTPLKEMAFLGCGYIYKKVDTSRFALG